MKYIFLFLLFFTCAAQEPIHILIASPINQTSLLIISEFLASLEHYKLPKEYVIEYLFSIDTHNLKIHEIINSFIHKNSNSFILPIHEGKLTSYKGYIGQLWHLAGIKNEILCFARKKQYDYLLLIDNDLILHPECLNSLINSNKDIIAPLFFVKSESDPSMSPYAWLYNADYQYQRTLYEQSLSDEEKKNRRTHFIQNLKKRGIHEVGGAGGCILLNKKLLNSNVLFKEIENSLFVNPDVHFCIRALVRNFSIFVNSSYPVFKFKKESEYNDLQDFKLQCGIY